MCNSNCPEHQCRSWDECLTRYEDVAQCPIYPKVYWTDHAFELVGRFVDCIDQTDAMAHVDDTIDPFTLKPYKREDY